MKSITPFPGQLVNGYYLDDQGQICKKVALPLSARKGFYCQNWQKLVCLTAVKLISVLKPVIDRRRRLALIVDDTLMARSCSKKTELLAKVYDHDKHEFLTGYRGLTIGWSDGNTFLPVNFALMSTKKKKNMIGSQPVTTDQRSIASRRRTQAQRPMNKS